MAVHLIGARRSYALPAMLEREGMLERLATDFYCRRPWHRALRLAYRMSPSPALQGMMNRHQPLLPDSKVVQLGWRGIQAVRGRRRAQTIMDSLRINDALAREIALLLRPSSNRFNALYCFALTAYICRDVFRDKPIVMDQMHIPLKKLIPVMQREFEQFGGWFTEDPDDYATIEREMVAIEESDVRAADVVLCPSEATRKNLLESYSIDSGKVLLNPYPNPLWLHHFGHPGATDSIVSERGARTGKLRVLFVGRVGVRKGIVYLLQALDGLDPERFEVRIAGPNKLQPKKTEHYAKRANFLGRIEKSELAAQLTWADVFVFPSLGEGSAGVVQEAMAFGLPIVTTFESGADLKDGVEGIVVPERDSEAIAAALMRYAGDRGLVEQHGRNALTQSQTRELGPSARRLKEVLKSISVPYASDHSHRNGHHSGRKA